MSWTIGYLLRHCELHHRFECLDYTVNFIEEWQVYLDREILDAQDNLDIDDSVPVAPVGRDLYSPRGPENCDADGLFLYGWHQ